MSTLDLRDAFHQLHLYPTEDETQGEPSKNGRRKSQKTKKSTKQLSDSDTFDEE